ncbi:MAG: cell division protein FtsZ, partial [Clostridiales bacterium]
ADDVLRQGVQGISDLIGVHGLINLDFADVRTVLLDTGLAHMGIGRASGENRAEEAAKQAIQSPLLETSIEGAKGVLLNITGSSDFGLYEVNAAAELVQKSADPEANIIFGAVIDENLNDEVIITVIATGFERKFAVKRKVLEDDDSVTTKDSSLFKKERIVSSEPENENDELRIDIPTFLRRKNTRFKQSNSDKDKKY